MAEGIEYKVNDVERVKLEAFLNDHTGVGWRLAEITPTTRALEYLVVMVRDVK